jgi:hypothetical protein
MLAGVFTGVDNQVDFYSVADSPDHVDGNGEIKAVEIAIEPSGTDNLLVRRVWRNNPTLSQNPLPPDEEVICRGVTNFLVEYFDGTDWQEAWDPTQYNNTLPAAVRVTLELQRPGPDGQPRTITNVSVFALPCSTNSYNPTAGTNGSNGLGGF